MYLRPAFVETDLDRMEALISAHPFGLLVTADGGMDASHIPFTVERQDNTLIVMGHLAAANPQCRLLDGGTALAIFSGPHAYIAPGWYTTQPSVPTWDYAAVHLHGTLEAIDEGMAAHGDMLDALAKGDPHSFDVRDLSEKYRSMMFKGIRAFRLRATRIEAQWKMSQNRSIEDRKGVIAGLQSQGLADVAAFVAETLPAET